MVKTSLHCVTKTLQLSTVPSTQSRHAGLYGHSRLILASLALIAISPRTCRAIYIYHRAYYASAPGWATGLRPSFLRRAGSTLAGISRLCLRPSTLRKRTAALEGWHM
ncbi:uncharacterized protein M421DRAFT_143220 [Didymella exigua CBS 183.55]|uniref:Uncharacterized protein n=1 Tax=Didymella exigua CBS 183.55 TaxID=1150837 RepID=A0A6A5RMT4_9PLEO|nr:uncharacterized protein M421DRAFT_143220 [Didymella exigua CBS 183.55]KAF1928949.1 hypothetical protein M421DRAFT_143220 [Didymella exigua CBS 183.55]